MLRSTTRVLAFPVCIWITEVGSLEEVRSWWYFQAILICSSWCSATPLHTHQPFPTRCTADGSRRLHTRSWEPHVSCISSHLTWTQISMRNPLFFPPSDSVSSTESQNIQILFFLRLQPKQPSSRGFPSQHYPERASLSSALSLCSSSSSSFFLSQHVSSFMPISLSSPRTL